MRGQACWRIGVCLGCGATLTAAAGTLVQVCERCRVELELPAPRARPRTSLPLWGVPCPDGERRLLALQPTGWVPR